MMYSDERNSLELFDTVQLSWACQCLEVGVKGGEDLDREVMVNDSAILYVEHAHWWRGRITSNIGC